MKWSAEVCSDLLVADEQDAAVIDATGSIIWNYYKIDGIQSKRGVAQKMLCARSLTLHLRDAVHLEISHISLFELF